MAAASAHPVSFVVERSRTRIAPAAVASAAWHLAFAAFVVLLMRSGPPAGATSAAPRVANRSWSGSPEPGIGGGGGGGGKGMPEPPSPVQRRGDDAITVPVVNPPSLNPNQPPTDREPLQGVMIPVQSLAGAQESLPGAIEAPGLPTLSQGPGSGDGAGPGAGTGDGPGRGPGLGDGIGGNRGGRTYQPGSGITSPRVLREVKPQYTSDAMRAKVQGTVLVACVVRPDGTVGDVQIVRSLDPTFGLDLQAIAAVKQWKFAAGTRLGEPVAVRITIELTFTLR